MALPLGAPGRLGGPCGAVPSGGGWRGFPPAPLYSESVSLLDRPTDRQLGGWGSQLGDDPIQSTSKSQATQELSAATARAAQAAAQAAAHAAAQAASLVTVQVAARAAVSQAAAQATAQAIAQAAGYTAVQEALRHSILQADFFMSPCTAPEPPEHWQMVPVESAASSLAPANLQMVTIESQVAPREEPLATAMSPCTQYYAPLVALEPKSDETLVAEGLFGAAFVARSFSDGHGDPASLLCTAAVQIASAEALRVFGWPKLRAFQMRAIEAWAGGKNTFVLSGTGSGKSACFLLSALVSRVWHARLGLAGPPPVALVISPLVALMRDQVRRLQELGVSAAVRSPQCDDPNAWERAISGDLAVCYMSPELVIRLTNNGQLARLRNVSLLAIDEVHCVSEWGHDFRPEYGQLREVIRALAGVRQRAPPVICLTATCTPEVRGDVMRSLNFDSRTAFVMGTMNRPNLYLAVEEIQNRTQMDTRLLELVGAGRPSPEERRAARVDGKSMNIFSPTVVYARLKSDCVRLADLLVAGGVRAAAFHSGFDNERKQWVQDAFNRNEIQVVVATIAFGMGIDKPDVRRVVHYGMPSSLEAYAQESGRAGRDGALAECCVLYSAGDRNTRERASLMGEDPGACGLRRKIHRLQQASFYCRTVSLCRRAHLLQRLGEHPCAPCGLANSQVSFTTGHPGFCSPIWDRAGGRGAVFHCGRCDVCCTPAQIYVRDFRRELKVLLTHAEECHGGRSQLVMAVQRGGQRLNMSKEVWARIMEAAVDAEFLEMYPVAVQSSTCIVPKLTDAGRQYLASEEGAIEFLVDAGEEPLPDVNDRFARISVADLSRPSTGVRRVRNEGDGRMETGAALMAAAGERRFQALVDEEGFEGEPPAQRARMGLAIDSRAHGVGSRRHRASVRRVADGAAAASETEDEVMSLAGHPDAGVGHREITFAAPAPHVAPLSAPPAAPLASPPAEVFLVDSLPPEDTEPGAESEVAASPPAEVLLVDSDNDSDLPLVRSRAPMMLARVPSQVSLERAFGGQQHRPASSSVDPPLAPVTAGPPKVLVAAAKPCLDLVAVTDTPLATLADVKQALAQEVAAINDMELARYALARVREMVASLAQPPLCLAPPPSDPLPLHDAPRRAGSSASCSSGGAAPLTFLTETPTPARASSSGRGPAPLAQALRSTGRTGRRASGIAAAVVTPAGGAASSAIGAAALAVGSAVGGAAARAGEGGGRRKKSAGRPRRYSDTEKAAALPLHAKVMEAADFNSNCRGGTTVFRRLIGEAKRLASAAQQRQLEEVSRIFNAKTLYVHGYRLDELLVEWGAVTPPPAADGA